MLGLEQDSSTDSEAEDEENFVSLAIVVSVITVGTLLCAFLFL
jgi:hypothetical protein